MTAAEKRELQAQQMHPKLYRLGQNGILRAVGDLFWTPKALKDAKKHRIPVAPTPRAQRPVTRAYRPFMAASASTPRMVVVHIHEGAHVHF